MDKRYLLAFALSFVVLLLYWMIFPPPSTAPKKEASATEQPTKQATPAVLSDATTQPAAKLAGKVEDFVLETKLVKASFSTLEGKLNTFYLKDYAYELPYRQTLHLLLWDMLWGKKEQPVPYNPERRVDMIDPTNLAMNKVLAFYADPAKTPLVYQKEVKNKENGSIELRFFATTPAGLLIEKLLTFRDQSYSYDLKVSVTNLNASPVVLNPSLVVGEGNETIEHSYQPKHKVGMYLLDGSFKKISSIEKDEVIANPTWSAVSDTYFIVGAIAKGENRSWAANFSPITGKIAGAAVLNPLLSLQTSALNLGPKEVFSQDFSLYMGPKDFKLLEAFDPTFPESLDLFFNLLARPLLHLLRWFGSWIGNWGLALMLLTFCVRLVLFPLAYKSMVSMRRLASLNPRVLYLRKKHEKDKLRLNQEIMQLYKKNKVNPVTGCLPMLMQIPIFLALYWMLLPAIELRQQPFYGWIHDLSMADPYLVLPLLMGVTLFIQQKISPPPANLDPIQQKIMLFFPVVLTLMFVNFPSGLVLYWVTSNTITVLQQLIFNKVKLQAVVE